MKDNDNWMTVSETHSAEIEDSWKMKDLPTSTLNLTEQGIKELELLNQKNRITNMYNQIEQEFKKVKNKIKQVNVNFKPLHPNCHLPAKATELAAGWDVTCTEIEQPSEDFVICKLGFALTPPSNYRIVLVPRSSLTKTHWVLQNSPGTGDPDYTGEYQYRFRAIPIGIEDGRLTYEPFPYKVGERIGQMYLQKIIDIKFEIKINLNETTRGAGGFGSTGTQAHTNI